MERNGVAVSREPRLARTLVDVADNLVDDFEQLDRALQSRIIIEQSKGIISERERVDIETAFELLRSRARTQNQRLVDLANEVVNGLTRERGGQGLDGQLVVPPHAAVGGLKRRVVSASGLQMQTAPAHWRGRGCHCAPAVGGAGGSWALLDNAPQLHELHGDRCR